MKSTKKKVIEFSTKLGDHALLAMLSGLLLGAIEGAVKGPATDQSHLAWAIITGGALLAVFGALVGLLQGLALIPSWSLFRKYFWERLQPYIASEKNANRGPVVLFHSFLAAALTLTSIGTAVLWVLFKILGNLENIRFAGDLRLIVTLGAMIGTIAGSFVLVRLFEQPLRFIDRKVGLPFPRSSLLRYLIYLVIPAGLVMVYLAHRHRDLLGFDALVFWAPSFFIAQGLFYLGRKALGTSGAGKWVTRSGIGIGIGSALWLIIFADVTVQISSKSPGAQLATHMIRRVTDVDRDGFSSFLAGGDCAPFDPGINAMAEDIPNNGIDENCNGQDEQAGTSTTQLSPQDTYYGALPESSIRNYNVVWIIVEAFRADHASVLDYKKHWTTPQLERLARESLVFSNAYSQSSITHLALPGLLIGKTPLTMQWNTEKKYPRPDDSYTTFTEMLAELKYRTGVIANLSLGRKSSWLKHGARKFDVFNLDKNRQPWIWRSSPITVSKSLEFLYRDRSFGKEKSKPFSLLTFFYDPHASYHGHLSDGVPEFGTEVLDRYDAEIRFTDRHIGFLLDALRYKPSVWEKTIVIVTGDHGEEFGEHGSFYHGQTCYKESLHVPLIMRIPGIKAKRIDTRVALIDIMPTLIELLGLDPPSGQIEGQSLLIPALSPTRVDSNRPIFCSIASPGGKLGRFFRRSVRAGKWHYVVDDISGTRELYNLEKDSRELRNLVDQRKHADKAKQLQAILDSHRTGNLMDIMKSQ